MHRTASDGDRSPAPARADAARQSTKGAILILVIAAIVVAPEFTIGVTVSDSYRFNILWPDQFGDLFRSGHLYPRWLPLSWDGFGSPNFYFYPPLFFWVSSSFDALTLGSLPPERFVPLATLTFLASSGLAMRAWLRVHLSEQRALVGAIAYMLAPYHLYDIYARGALAEATAYAFVPLVMLALCRLGDDRPKYAPLLSLSYAAMLMTHLPTALLLSVFLIPPYAAFVAGKSARPDRFLGLALLGGLIGIGIAAIYLLPALTLLPYVSPGALSGSFYRPESWFFWHLDAGAMSSRMILIIPVTVALFVVALGSVRTSRLPLFWSGMTIVLAILIAGLIPPVWSLPGLKLVQFPWRGLLLAEFTAITALAIRLPPLRSPEVLISGLLAAFAYSVLLLMIGHTIGRTWDGRKQTAAEIRLHYLDAPEYLPAGTRISQGKGADDVSYDLPRVPLASASLRDAVISASEDKDGGMSVTVNATAPTQISLHRFYFPHWRVHDAAGREVPVKAHPQQRVVTFTAPAGRSVFSLDLGMAPYEVLARIVSLVALLALAAMAIVTGLAHRRPGERRA